jgi:hypothetical protein
MLAEPSLPVLVVADLETAGALVGGAVSGFPTTREQLCFWTLARFSVRIRRTAFSIKTMPVFRQPDRDDTMP